jgi:hypothetical protein
MASITQIPSVAWLLQVGFPPDVIKTRIKESLELATIRKQYETALGTTDIDTIYDYHRAQPAVGP